MRPADWKAYSCSGTLTVEEITQKNIKGTFIMEVYDGDQLIHKTANGKFLLNTE
jgi:hypothetical protein